MLLLPTMADAQKKDVEGLLNKLLAPGPLMEGHKKLENTDCLDCHEPAGGVPDNRCLKCHDDIKKSIARGKSYHARSSRKANCVQCHKDHKGRKYNSVFVNQKTFDHNKTGFPLTNAHAKPKCADCHTKKRTKKPIRRNEIRYFGNISECKSCHADDDIHYFIGKYKKKDCNVCHSTIDWDKGVKWNHNKETRHILLGNHAKLSCQKCHVPRGKPPVKYKWPDLKQEKCGSCHSDYHGDNLSNKFQNGDCGNCHNQNTWKNRDFKHKGINFPLLGQHARNTCEDCHTKADKGYDKKKLWKGLDPNCTSCHGDFHLYANQKSKKRGSLNNCRMCHGDGGFKEGIKFNHDKDTAFPLIGEHKKVECNDCHIKVTKKKRKYRFPEYRKKTCETCHTSPHSEKFFRSMGNRRRCSSCHSPEGWRVFKDKSIVSTFNHDDTRFPLTGAHKKQTCSSCHRINGKGVYKFPNANKKFCLNCHETVHKRQFTKRFLKQSCALCHTTTAFKPRKRFNHNLTQFKIDGAHNKIRKQCSKCHVKSNLTIPTKPPRKGQLFKFQFASKGYCEHCHNNVHKKQFHRKFATKSCKACHSTSSFLKKPPFNHNQTRWVLEGKHRKVKCNDCHVPTRKRFKESPRRRMGKYIFKINKVNECNICHADIHKPTRGKDCSQCHTPGGWGSGGGVGGSFHAQSMLIGAHNFLSCNQCHTNGRRLEGASENCIMCHAKDDHHNGALVRCETCHSQQIWDVTRFRHSNSRFPLQGIHRTLECGACHNTGIYEGTPENCISCHFSDAATRPSHNTPNYTNCEECHSQYTFKQFTGGGLRLITPAFLKKIPDLK